MGQLEDMRLFVQIAEAGSISKAAARMNIAKSAVSRRLLLLEQRMGTRLIDRAPGVWTITDTGRELAQRAARIISEMDEIEDDFANTTAAVEGPLSVSIPREFGLALLGPALIDFKARHPQIRLTVSFDDRPVDLARENVDMAVRITNRPDPELTATRIATTRHALFASAAYLNENPPVETLDDLQAHQLLHYGSAHRANWEFLSPTGKAVEIPFRPFLNSNSGVFLLNAAIAGMGIARLPDFIADNRQSLHNLMPVLPDVAIRDWGVYLVRSPNRRLNRRMRLFGQAMARACQSEASPAL